MTEEKKVYITDGQNLADKAEQLRKEGYSDVTIRLSTMNYTRYKETNEGKELQPVIDGINKAVDAGLHVRICISIREGYNDNEILDLLQLTLLHNYDIVFMPTMDYDKIKAKMPALKKLEPKTGEDFGEVDLYKYPMAKGRIGFLKN
ncbi:MAG: hypothetical protein PHS19_01900 [Eubacteriales bacterium]|nr:hypothetical protein [Eubacteriales bacterium]